MDFYRLQSAVADTLVWDPNSVKVETYASIDDILPTVVDLMEWMVPESKIPPALRCMDPLSVSPCTSGTTDAHLCILRFCPYVLPFFVRSMYLGYLGCTFVQPTFLRICASIFY